MRNAPLFLAYIFLFAPAGLAMRLLRDPLRRRVSRRAASYWAPVQPPEPPPDAAPITKGCTW